MTPAVLTIDVSGPAGGVEPQRILHVLERPWVREVRGETVVRFDPAEWGARLAGLLGEPERVDPKVRPTVDLPWDLLVAVPQARREGRPDLADRLLQLHAGSVAVDGRPAADPTTTLAAFADDPLGVLRVTALARPRCDRAAQLVWLRTGDGWWTMRARTSRPGHPGNTATGTRPDSRLAPQQRVPLVRLVPREPTALPGEVAALLVRLGVRG